MRQESVGMDIEKTIIGAGVKWIRKVDPYDLNDSMNVLRDAYDEDKGLRSPEIFQYYKDCILVVINSMCDTGG